MKRKTNVPKRHDTNTQLRNNFNKIIVIQCLKFQLYNII